MSDLHALIYVSRSTIDLGSGCAADSINDIVTAARINNPKHGITGALLFDDVFFAQMLEGPKQAVEMSFQSIGRDPRHRNVTVLSFETATCRRFAEWSMAYAGASRAQSPAIWSEAIMSNPDEVETARAGQKIIDLLVSLIRHEDARQGFALG